MQPHWSTDTPWSLHTSRTRFTRPAAVSIWKFYIGESILVTVHTCVESGLGIQEIVPPLKPWEAPVRRKCCTKKKSTRLGRVCCSAAAMLTFAVQACHSREASLVQPYICNASRISGPPLALRASMFRLCLFATRCRVRVRNMTPKLWAEVFHSAHQGFFWKRMLRN